ncbi:hypothetical protein [Acetobacter conturbans]|uniref:hypothetical protein n=1 Tax=Acetobacter conturbans TaxID=1737472 RepID=UPI0030D43F47
MTALTASQKAHAQFAPAHSDTYLDSRRDSELHHQTLARMLMTIGMNPDEAPPLDTVTPSAYQMPTRPFAREETPPRKPHRPLPNLPHYNPAGSYEAPRRIPAVVQVNREIGLSMTGAWSNYKEKPLWAGPSTGYDRETGWVPGFQFDASDMFDMYEIDHVFLALHFALGDGNVGYNGSIWNLAGGIAPYKTSSHRLTTDSRIEIGKGFMVNNSFMITPTIVGGYWSWNRDIKGGEGVASSSEAYGGFLAGIMVHLDYAITDAFVLRGQLGWTELLGSRMDAAGTNGTFHLRPRPEWSAALDFDYRISHSIHLIAGVRYAYYSFGRSQSQLQHDGPFPYSLYEPSSWTNGVTMHTGLAYAF